MERAVSLTNQTSTRLVTVCDRESDVYEFLVKTEQLKTGVLIRASNDRLLYGGKRDKKRSMTIWKHMKQQPCQGIVEIEITDRTQKNSVRSATVEVRFDEIELRPPQRRPSAKKKN